MKLYYQFPGTWFGDCMPFGKGDEFFLFHQRDNRNPEPFGEPFGWDLATTKDFVDYRDCGVGMFGLNRAFRIQEDENGSFTLNAINNIDSVLLSDLIGYEPQKKELRQNTEAFVSGRAANNVLLYGDAGTGKSTSVKAILNEYADRGLRMIEIYKHQFGLLSQVIAKIKNRNYRFMIFIDDLSFEEHEVEYKFLKAVIEGGVETRPANVLIVATSNRRHLVQETWKDRDDMEHLSLIHI